jgi:outer membrane protein assembly factor BamB
VTRALNRFWTGASRWWPFAGVPVAGVFLLAAAPGATAQPTNFPTNFTRWSVPVGQFYGYHKDSSPVIGADGTIYIGTTDGRLHALRPDGTKKWAFRTKRDIKSSPAIARDGTIYFGSRDRNLYAVTPAGERKWSFATKGWVDASPALANDGTVLFGSWDKTFYAVDAAGHLKWSFATAGPIVSSAAIGSDGTIYFGSHDKRFYALAPDGSKKWAFTTGGEIISSPALQADGTICFTSVDGKLYALDPDGRARWQLATGGITESSPVVDASGNIYIGVNENLFCVGPDGKKRWDRRTDNAMIDGTPALTDGGLVYFGARYPVMYALSTTGEKQWIAWLGGDTVSSPNLAPDHTIYIGSRTPNFTAIKGTNSLAKSSWPMFRRNPRHTGNVADEK